MPQIVPSFQKLKTFALKNGFKNLFFDLMLMLGFVSCALIGPFPQYSMLLSAVLLLCIGVSFFSDHFYLYTALFLFMRYRMLLGDTPAFRIYSYLVVIKFLTEVSSFKIRTVYLPAILVFALHSIFATGNTNFRLGLNIIVDVLIIYVILARTLADDNLMRRFMIVFMLGAIASGIYGYTAIGVSKDINVAGAGVRTINRNFGALSDANFACLFYISAIFSAILIKGIPNLLRIALAGFFFILLLQTASLTGIITFSMIGVLFVILKFRKKSILILLILLLAAILLLSIPAVRRIEAIASILLRVEERLHFIRIGRWDMLTTGRTDLWRDSFKFFNEQSILQKLFGGNVVTILLTTTHFRGIEWACHQSIIQSLLNFGVLGTMVIFLPLFAVSFYRFIRHMFRPAGYANEDIKIIQLLFSATFIIMSMTVDMFIDWPFLFFYFI